MTVKEASIWASEYLKKNVTASNISYLIQYGRIPKKSGNGATAINQHDLEKYYKAHYETKADRWKKYLGDDLNWDLSFSEYRESETTKHVHRLHPYKGKFIPQLVEYFLDKHVDKFKNKSFFKPGDIVLDPFCGSGTTLVQASELGINALGIDVSAFNSFITNVKIENHNVDNLKESSLEITHKLKAFQKGKNNVIFEQKLLNELKIFNNKFFPSPEFKYKVRQNEINEKQYGNQKANEFFHIYQRLINEHQIELKQQATDTFIDKWFLKVIRDEIDFVFNEINTMKNQETKKVLSLILSRTIRSCRATTHADLATLKAPVTATYYCKKHGKICKPLFSILNWWQRYSQDTIKRIKQFDALKSDTFQKCLVGDSRNINIIEELKVKFTKLSGLVERDKIAGIFSSPPYVGLINYHEQHAYAYDLFDFDRKDKFEIGPLFNGQGLKARESYVKGISDVLNNCKRYLKPDYNIFLVANDKYNLYPQIAELADMQITKEHKRPVLNRVEKSRSAYSETIFHLKEKANDPV